MDNQNQLVFAFDGDEIGKRHAQAILSDDLDQVKLISETITEGNNFIREFVESNGGTWISGGGDEGSFTAPAEFVELLEQIRKDYQYMVDATLSIGYGQTISQAGKALLVAKERGKDQVVQYDDSVEEEVQQIEGEESDPNDAERKKIKAVLSSEKDLYNPNEVIENPENNGDSDSGDYNGASDDEGVGHDQVLPEGSDAAINEPTLCEPPKEDNNLGYDSGYRDSNKEDRKDSYEANDLTPPVIKKPNLTPKPRVEQAVSTDIQESDRLMNEELPDPKDAPAVDKKPAPRNYHGQAEGDAAPESMAQPMIQKPGDLKYSPGNQGKPDACIPRENATSDQAMETESQDMGVKHCSSCTCDEHQEPMENVLDQHIENAKDFANTLDEGGEMGDKNKEMGDVLDQHIDNANEMMDQNTDENGISRPLDYDQKDGDMGLSEEEADSDEPQLDEVLQSGLDQHADNIQKEKVVQMVGEALEGFKSQKAILDKAKQQAPELYSSCLSMLRAMIELCSLAGLGNEGEAEQEVNEIEGQSEAPEEMPGAEEMPEEALPESKDSCPNCGHEQPPKEESPFPKK